MQDEQQHNNIITTRDLKNIVLPPFLPEEIIIDDNDIKNDDDHNSINNNYNDKEEIFKLEQNDDDDDVVVVTSNTIIESDNDDRNDDSSSQPVISSSVMDHINKMYQSTIKPTFIPKKPKVRVPFQHTIQQWIQKNEIKKKQERNTKRQLIMNELIAIQQFKRKQLLLLQNHRKKNKKVWFHNNKQQQQQYPITTSTLAPLGYALITGASRGIGRAFAIELARYEIPLILIARDEQKLKALAIDIQTAYGVPCIVIKADLSKRNTAQYIYETTKKAGLKVDILINNAGVCKTKDIVLSNEDDIQRMMDINVASTTMLSHLYAKEMKDARRGRILFVSSMVGAVPSGPGVATYAATKAYEKSLAQSMGRELERYGVGVTCLMPGAVKDTSFALRSDANEATCFKVPFYPLKAQSVASTGVRALLHSGDGEVIPGWPNRLFLKILMPVLPPRLTSSIVALAWSPFRLPWGIGGSGGGDDEEESSRLKGNLLVDTQNEQMESIHDRMSTVLYDKSPRILELPVEEEKKKVSDNIEIIKETEKDENSMDEGEDVIQRKVNVNEDNNESVQQISLITEEKEGMSSE